MAINLNESDKEALGKRIYHAFLELTISCVISIVALATAFIVGGYCLQQTQTYPILALSLISIGSSLIGIGIISIPFKAAAVHLMEEKIVKNAAITTMKEMEHTYIPKMIFKRANISVTIVASENNNIPKMKISEQVTLRNLQERTIDRRIRKVHLYNGQTHTINNIEVNIKGTNSKVTPSSLKHSQIIEGTYLFSIDTKFEEELNKGIISEELKEEFKKNGFSLPDNATVKKEEKKWEITDEKKFIIRKEEGKLNIYEGTKTTEMYTYYIPFVSALNKGEDVCIKEDYEWSPCRATPNTSDYDEFMYKLSFPAEALIIRMKAEDNFYFVLLEKKVTDTVSEREVGAQSSPVVTKETNGQIKEAEWIIPLSDLTHLTEYEIRFRVGII